MTEEEIREAAQLPEEIDAWADALGPGGMTDLADGPLFVGTCHGGPWDGVAGESRYPKGFLLAHRPHGQVWIYDRRDDGDFYARSAVPEVLRDQGDVNRFRAADEANYDIRVVEW